MLPHGCSLCTSGMEHKGPCTHKKCIWAIQKLISSNQTLKNYSHHGSRQPACLICGPLAVSQNQLPLPQPVCLSLNIFILSLTPVVDFFITTGAQTRWLNSLEGGGSSALHPGGKGINEMAGETQSQRCHPFSTGWGLDANLIPNPP